MSINPAVAIGPITETQVQDVNVRPKQSQPAAEPEISAQPVLGSPLKQNAAAPSSAVRAAEPLQDEVDVHHDSQTGGDIIIQYKDQSGNLILQLPSSEVLGVARSIYKDFRAEAKAHETASQTGNEGGNPHDN